MKGSTSGRGGQPGKDGGNRSPSPAARRRARAAIAEKQKRQEPRGVGARRVLGYNYMSRLFGQSA